MGETGHADETYVPVQNKNAVATGFHLFMHQSYLRHLGPNRLAVASYAISSSIGP